MRLDVVNLFVKNMERTVEFYRLLGFHLPEGVEKKGYIKTGDSGTPLCFYSFSLVEQYFGNKIKGNFAGHPTELSVRLNNPTVVDEMFRRVVEAGFSAFQDPSDAAWGQRVAFVLDPDGNLVEICAYIEKKEE